MSKRITLSMAVFMAALVLVLAAVYPASPGHWKEKWDRFSGIAGETLAEGDAVCIGTDGRVYKAEAEDSTRRPAVGVIGKGGTNGTNVEIVRSGIFGGLGTGNTTVDGGRNGTALKLWGSGGANLNGYFNSTGTGNQTLGFFLRGGYDALVDVSWPAPAEAEY